MTSSAITGGRELGEKLKLLRTEVATKIAFQGALAMATVIKKEAQRRAPVADADYTVRGVKVEPGNISRNIVTKKVSRTEHTAEYVVALRGKRKDGYANRIAILQEFGAPHGANTQPFMGPALIAKKDEAIAACLTKLATGIAKAAKS